MFGANYVSGESTGCIGQHKDSVESVALNAEMQIGASAGIDEQIIVYDLAHLTIRHKLSPTQYGGFTMLKFSSFPIKVPDVDEKVVMLYAGSTLGEFFVIDVRSGKVAVQKKGHVAPINYFCEIPTRQQVVTAGDDN